MLVALFHVDSISFIYPRCRAVTVSKDYDTEGYLLRLWLQIFRRKIASLSLSLARASAIAIAAPDIQFERDKP